MVFEILKTVQEVGTVFGPLPDVDGETLLLKMPYAFTAGPGISLEPVKASSLVLIFTHSEDATQAARELSATVLISCGHWCKNSDQLDRSANWCHSGKSVGG